MRWLTRRIHDRIERVAGLDRDIEDGHEMLAELEVNSWRIALHEIEGERFVVLPSGT